jgi:hypothetical protein
VRHVPAKPWAVAAEEHLRAFRGAISTVRLRLPYGPRPDQDDNVLFAPTYPVYGAEDRARMRTTYRSRGYMHWAIGPVSHRRALYHDQYPPAPFDSIAEPNKYAHRLEELWRAGEIPVYFALPDTPDFMNRDGWDWSAVERELTPIYASSRWQALVRVVVLAWEPDIPAAEWERGVRWLARVFPRALRYVHLPADHSAPCRASDLTGSRGAIAGEGACWKRIAPFIHGVLYQCGGMGRQGAVVSGRTPIEQFRYDLWNMRRRLQDGIADWPTKSAVPRRPLDVVAFEYASYWNYWKNVPEAEARRWGDAAMGAGSPTLDPVAHVGIDLRGKLAGYGDGGTVAPRRSGRTRPPMRGTAQ